MGEVSKPQSSLPLCDQPECTREDHLVGFLRNRVESLEEQLERAEQFIAKQGMEYRFAEFCGGVANPASEPVSSDA